MDIGLTIIEFFPTTARCHAFGWATGLNMPDAQQLYASNMLSTVMNINPYCHCGIQIIK
jgi:hypothetical protein